MQRWFLPTREKCENSAAGCFCSLFLLNNTSYASCQRDVTRQACEDQDDRLHHEFSTNTMLSCVIRMRICALFLSLVTVFNSESVDH